MEIWSFRIGVLLLAVNLVISGHAMAQTDAKRPLTLADIERLWGSQQRTGSDLVRPAIKEYGVVEIDAKAEQRLRDLKIPANLIDEIKNQIRTGAIRVECQPVDCEVSINNVPAGATEG